QRDHVERGELAFDLGLHAEIGERQVLRGQHPLADEKLPRLALRVAGVRAERVRLHRNAPPPERRKAVPAQERVDARLQRRSVVPLAEREEDDADAQLVPGREPLALGDELFEERAWRGEEQAGAVAGVLDTAAPMLDAGKSGEGEIDQLVRG